MLILPETTRDDTLKAYASEFFIRYVQEDHTKFQKEIEDSVETEGKFDSVFELNWYIADTLFSDEANDQFPKYVEAVNKLWPEKTYPESADLFVDALWKNHFHIWSFALGDQNA